MEKADPKDVKLDVKKPEVTVGRIMSYYRPKWLTWLGCFLSVGGSFAWPLYGLIYCNLLFIMMLKDSPGYDFLG